MPDVGLQPTDTVLDLFCGTGTIGLSLARACSHVYGFDVAPSSVADAQRNAARNGISNATFVQADLDSLRGLVGKQMPQPDVIVTGKVVRQLLCNLRCVLVHASVPGIGILP